MGTQKRIRGACPCGYGFETSRSQDEAIVMVKTHFDQFHNDMLPFGITSTEARSLLTNINDERKPQSKMHPVYPAYPSPHDPRNAARKAKEKKTILLH